MDTFHFKSGLLSLPAAETEWTILSFHQRRSSMTCLRTSGIMWMPTSWCGGTRGMWIWWPKSEIRRYASTVLDLRSQKTFLGQV